MQFLSEIAWVLAFVFIHGSVRVIFSRRNWCSFNRLLSVSRWLCDDEDDDDTIETMESILFLWHIAGEMFKMQINEVIIHSAELHNRLVFTLMFTIRQMMKEIVQWQQEIITEPNTMCFFLWKLWLTNLFLYTDFVLKEHERKNWYAIMYLYVLAHANAVTAQLFKWYSKREGKSLTPQQKNVQVMTVSFSGI